MKRATLALVLLACAALASADLRAATPEAEQDARRSFERAESHFKAGLFAEALAEYQEGYDHLPLPGFLVNIAQCHRRLGNLQQARATYRKFIMVAPDSPYVPEVKALVAELDTLVASAEEAAAADAAKPGNPADQPSASAPAVPAAAAAEAEVRAPLTTVPDTTAPPRAGTRWWLWGTVGAAVVAGATTAVLLLRSPGTTTLHDGSLGTLRR
jgi:tetratricopeptide (TPR) repeat protein